MGLNFDAVQFLRSEQRRTVDFSRTLTLGRQNLYLEENEFLACFGKAPTEALVFADQFLQALGATSLSVMDASAYEGANIIHDLNEPIPESLKAQHSCVIDGGTLEHVFNIGIALRSAMEMVRLGGHLILLAPANNFVGHGFYQFSPELFYSALSPENGFEVERMVMRYGDKWFQIGRPADLRRRVEFFSPDPVLIFVSARRIRIGPVFSSWPYQVDYQAMWDANSPGTASPQLRMKDRVLRAMPGGLKLRDWWRNYRWRRSMRIRPCEHLKEISL